MDFIVMKTSELGPAEKVKTRNDDWDEDLLRRRHWEDFISLRLV